MIQSIDFFYRIAKEAGFAEDKNGNPSRCYMKLSFSLKKPINIEDVEAEREKIKDIVFDYVASLLNIDTSLLAVVTEEEYETEIEEN